MSSAPKTETISILRDKWRHDRRLMEAVRISKPKAAEAQSDTGKAGDLARAIPLASRNQDIEKSK
jgi:hypothetical protein